MNDYDQWQESGAEDFMDHMVDLMGQLAHQRAQGDGPEDGKASEKPVEVKKPAEVRLAGPARPVVEAAPEKPRIVPRRVRPGDGARRARPGGLGLRQG